MFLETFNDELIMKEERRKVAMAVSQNLSIDSHLSVCVHIDSLIVVAEEKLHPVRVGQHDDGVGRYGTGGVLWEVDVVDGGRVEVDGVEAAR